MKDYGFIRVAAACPAVSPGNIAANIDSIIKLAGEADEKRCDLVVFPELCVTGYTCADLFLQELLLDNAEKALLEIAELTRSLHINIVVGAPIRKNNVLYNCAVVITDGTISGAVPKSFIPNYAEFYEKRWFRPGIGISNETIKIGDREIPFGTDILFENSKYRLGVEICEDLWIPEPPSCKASKAGADIIANLSATDELIGKHDYLLSLISQQSARCRCGYIYASAGFGESSTDLVFAGNGIIACDGNILSTSKRFNLEPSLTIKDIDVKRIRNDRRKYSTFSESSDHPEFRTVEIGIRPDVNDMEYAYVDPYPFIDKDKTRLKYRCDEIADIQAFGLVQRLNAIKCRNAVIGISGGLDSTLALLVTVKAFDMLGLDRKGITAITMPGFGTTGRTYNNALELMRQLGVTLMEIPISEAVMLHFRDIGQDPEKHDATYENSQARERTQILMDMANKTGGIVIGTGDLSELALGWCTYNGDQMSMYGVNASIPKTLVKHLVENFAHREEMADIKDILLDIVATPISPELLPASSNDKILQKTEDLVGPYELHDFFIYNMLRCSFPPEKILRLAVKAFAGKYDEETILHWLRVFYRRFFSQQFKRSCMPDGPKVGSICLSPRGDWRMPSDVSAAMWLDF